MNANHEKAVEAYRKYRDGVEAITDDELAIAIPVLHDAAALLFALGPEFRFPASDLRLKAQQFEDFQQRRSAQRAGFR